MLDDRESMLIAGCNSYQSSQVGHTSTACLYLARVLSLPLPQTPHFIDGIANVLCAADLLKATRPMAIRL
jgi:hypothetical protein